jgi:hypothetical protein
VSKTNGHGRDVFSWDKDYDSWFERDNAAAANAAAANADAAADALAALLWQQADWDKADLPVEPDHASSPPMRRFIVLCQDWRQRRRRRCHCSSKIYSTRFPLIMLGIGRSEYETMLRRLQWMRWYYGTLRQCMYRQGPAGEQLSLPTLYKLMMLFFVNRPVWG